MLTTQSAPEIEQLSGKKARLSGYPPGSIRFDWLGLGLAVLLNCGLYLNSWVCNHTPTQNTFLTPWLGLLYGTYLMVALFFLTIAFKNHSAGYSRRRSLPKGYNLALPGVILYGLGILGDIFWYLTFGTNADTDPLRSPPRLVLAFSGLLIIGTLFRAVLSRVQVARPGWREVAPALISGGLLLAVLIFYTGYSQPFIEKNPSTNLANQLWGTDLYLMNPDGSAKTHLTNSNSFYSWLPRISPDGKRVVFTSGEIGKKTDQLYIMDLDGANRVQLTNLPGNNAGAKWSPAGTTIAFNSGLEDNPEIYTIKPDGTELHRLTNNPGYDVGPVWSPDGQFILFYSQKDGDYWHLYLMRPDGSEQTRLTRDNWYDETGSFSPDGNRIVYSSFRDINFQIYRMNRDGTNIVRLTNDSHDNRYPEWSPDGSSITFMSDNKQMKKIDIYRMKPDGSEPTNLTQNGVGVMSQVPYWSPDGSKIIYSTSFPLANNQFLALYKTRDLGVGSLSVQAAFLIGLIMLLIRRWILPVGALTLVMTLSSLLVCPPGPLRIGGSGISGGYNH